MDPDRIGKNLFNIINDGEIKTKINSELKTVAIIDEAPIGSKEEQEQEARHSEGCDEISELMRESKSGKLMKQMENLNSKIKKPQKLFDKSIQADIEDETNDEIIGGNL